MAVQIYNLWVLKSYIISAIAEAKNLNYNSIIVTNLSTRKKAAEFMMWLNFWHVHH